MYGAANPDRLPTELISAIPLAAATPDRNVVGSAQKHGRKAMILMAQMLTATIAATGLPRYSVTGMATPPTISGSATCQTRSLLRSPCRDHRYIATAPRTYG